MVKVFPYKKPVGNDFDRWLFFQKCGPQQNVKKHVKK